MSRDWNDAIEAAAEAVELERDQLRHVRNAWNLLRVAIAAIRALKRPEPASKMFAAPEGACPHGIGTDDECSRCVASAREVHRP